MVQFIRSNWHRKTWKHIWKKWVKCLRIRTILLYNLNELIYYTFFITQNCINYYTTYNSGYNEDDLPYNPRYSTYQGSSALPTIPEDGPPPPEDPVAFPEGPHKDDSDSASMAKESISSRTTCGKYFFNFWDDKTKLAYID